MKFKNKPNKLIVEHLTGDEYWNSRSVAVNGVIIIYLPGHASPYVLASRRGPNAADFRGRLNVIAGYLDWNETGPEAMVREAWEEVGINLTDLAYPRDEDSIWYGITDNSLQTPWAVNTDPALNHQNISLRYGIAIKLKDSKFPDLSLDNNEVEGEVSEAWWMPVHEIDNYLWAFDHDDVIKEYLVKINDHIRNYPK